MKTVPANESVRRGRLAKALQFKAVADDALALADEGHGVADAVVTLLVHAGIAASDAICAQALHEHAKGENHMEAAMLLHTVNPAAAKRLKRLLGMKTRAGYGHDPVTNYQLQQAERSAAALIDFALNQR